MINQEHIKVGSDIEVFLRDTQTGEYVSAIGRIGGTKHEPRPLDRTGCAIQEDNVAFEYNVPAVDLIGGSKDMIANIEYVLRTARAVTNLPENVEFVCCSSALFNEKELDNEKAQEFGCEPDYNAWNDALPNDKPEIEEKRLRSCGGHIHISYPEHTAGTSVSLVKVFDLFLGVPSVLIDRDTDRRRLYGKAGAFRFKNWGEDGGFEYRTLSNWWTSKPEYVEWVFKQIQAAFDFFNAQKVGVEIHAEDIQRAINESDAGLAEALCVQFGIEIPTYDHIETTQ